MTKRTTTLAATLALLLAAILAAPVSAATWSSVRKITDGSRPAAGSSIATTASSTTRYFYATWRRGAGKVEFARSSNGAETWGTPKVLTDTTMVFGEPRVAASANDVWVAWARTYEDPDTGTPGKGIVVRHNRSYGSSTAWDSSIRLTQPTGDVRPPSISVTDDGSSIYVVFSDLRNDTTRLMYSHDGGRIWISTIIGTGFDQDGEGVPTAIPVVAASGPRVVVAWLAEGNVATARVSTDAGEHFSDPEAIGSGLSTAHSRGGRLAVGGTGEVGPWLRIWQAGTWGPLREIPEITLGGQTAAAVDLDIVVNTDGRIGAVYSAQVDVDEETGDTWEEITWFAGTNDGAAWSGPTRVSRAGSETVAYDAARPTAIWFQTDHLWIAWLYERATDPGTYFFALRERS